jgi:acyl-CoA thioesterase-2
MHSGRAWGSDTITAYQGDRLLSRGLVLLNTVEPDLMRHMPAMPDVPGPDAATPNQSITVFPGTEARMVDAPDAVGADGSPAMYFWFRHPESYDSVAASQALIAWCQPGFIIGLAMLPHSETVNIGDAHTSISTGVISHTAHFHEHADVGEWLLVAQEASYAGRGRVFGTGAVFTQDGTLVSTFAQDSMARGVEGTLDPKRGM